MSYHIYTIKGLILSSRGIGEADRVYKILTRDFGLIFAKATGVRNGRSKLRGALEPFSLSTVSLVRGKDYWRLTSSELIRKIPKGKSLAQPFFLLEKLVQGEEPHPELFDAVEENLSSPETRLVSLILYHLGYLEKSDLELEDKPLIARINQGLKASNLI